MAVITMTREMGSLGRDVALGLADRLGLELVQHELVEHIAEKMHMRESSVNRFLEGRSSLLERWESTRTTCRSTRRRSCSTSRNGEMC